jgi:UDP-N-acetylglucosamine 2-epimerase (non-hydrolysing)
MVNLDKIKASGILGKLKLSKGGYLVVSVHREENVDNSANLHNLLVALEKACDEFHMPVVVSTHPRTKDRLSKLKRVDKGHDIRFMKPFGFLDYVNLQMNSFCVISDSGTICEESSILGFPAITVRNSIERPEAIDAGSIVVTGLDPDVIVAGIRLQTAPDIKKKTIHVPDDYRIENTSHRVVKLILGTHKVTHLWDNIRPNDLV